MFSDRWELIKEIHSTGSSVERTDCYYSIIWTPTENDQAAKLRVFYGERSVPGYVIKEYLNETLPAKKTLQ